MVQKCHECHNWFDAANLVACHGGCLGFFCDGHLKEYKDKDGMDHKLCPGCYDNCSQK